jgi:ketosteroid isomerase-like protein
MSRENVEVVRAVYERWSGGDFRTSVDVFDPLILFVLRPEFPDAGTYLGLERFVEYTRGLLDAWTRFTIEAKEIVADAGDSVVVAALQCGVGAGSGVESTLGYFHVWSFRGRRVIRLEAVRERGEALEAVGLSE